MAEEAGSNVASFIWVLWLGTSSSVKYKPSYFSLQESSPPAPALCSYISQEELNGGQMIRT